MTWIEMCKKKKMHSGIVVVVTSGASFCQLSCMYENNQVLSLVVPFTRFLQIGY